MLSGLYSGIKAILALKDGYDSSSGSTDEKLIGAIQAMQKDQKNNIMMTYDGNMANVLSQHMVEPVIIISNNVARDDISKQVLELNMDLFCSYYCQVYEILKVADGLSGKEAVSLLSTDGKSLPAAIRDYSVDNYLKLKSKMSFESMNVDPSAPVKFGLESLSVSMEANSDNEMKAINELLKISKSKDKRIDLYKSTYDKTITKKEHMANVDAGVAEKASGYDKKDAAEQFVNDERARLEGGIKESDYKGYDLLSTILYKTFYIDYNMPLYNDVNKLDVDKYYKVRFPITIKARIIFAKPEDIVNMIEPFSTDVNFFSRLESYRSSAISFFKDMVWCDDLIKDAKKNKLHDEKNLIKLLNDRTSSANAKIISDKPGIGFEKNYNMLILSEDDIPAIERVVGGKLKEEVNMNKLLKISQSLSCTIVDFDYDRVNLSLSGGIGKSSTTFQTLKKKNNGGKEDLTELIKLLMANKSLSF